MTREEKIFEMAKAIAPIVAEIGIDVQNKIVKNGGDPSRCTVCGKDIPHAYGESLRVWAEAFVDELTTIENEV